jgi:flavin-dependent dehydrogenase
MKAGAVTANTARFCLSNWRGPVRTLPQSALCLSRFHLDALLARQFADAGGQLRTDSRWRERFDDEGIVQANGRRPAPGVPGPRWFGFKAHATGVRLEADLEMHVIPRGYVGLCRLAGDVVNVCGLFRRDRKSASAKPVHWQTCLQGLPGSPLHDRLKDAVWDPQSMCAIAGLSLQPQRAAGRPECAIGDALTMIPPLTGNGMSMALEAAELAVEPLSRYSRGAQTWAGARDAIARQLDTRFSRRLRWANRCQRLLFTPALGPLAVMGLSALAPLWRGAFEKTRA